MPLVKKGRRESHGRDGNVMKPETGSLKNNPPTAIGSYDVKENRNTYEDFVFPSHDTRRDRDDYDDEGRRSLSLTPNPELDDCDDESRRSFSWTPDPELADCDIESHRSLSRTPSYDRRDATRRSFLRAPSYDCGEAGRRSLSRTPSYDRSDARRGSFVRPLPYDRLQRCGDNPQGSRRSFSPDSLYDRFYNGDDRENPSDRSRHVSSRTPLRSREEIHDENVGSMSREQIEDRDPTRKLSSFSRPSKYVKTTLNETPPHLEYTMEDAMKRRTESSSLSPSYDLHAEPENFIIQDRQTRDHTPPIGSNNNTGSKQAPALVPH
jgi:hypothetical protein